MITIIKRIHTICSNHASIIRTIYYNFKYLPVSQACKLPMIVAKGVRIWGNGKISLEDWNMKTSPSIYIGGKALKWMPFPKEVPTIWQIDGTLRLKPNFYFGSGGGIEVGEGAVLSFETGFNATGRCTIVCRNKINFGIDTLVSWDTLFMDSDQHTLLSKESLPTNPDTSIEIGNHVWISSKVTILKNSIVANHCVIGCNSLVHGKYLQDNVLIAGIPSRICKEDIEWSSMRPSKENMERD